MIILLAQFTDYKYNSYKILRFLIGGYIGTSGDEFHILYRLKTITKNSRNVCFSHFEIIRN